MRKLLMVMAAIFLLLVIGYQGLSFLGETMDEIMVPIEWAKDLSGLVLALSVLFFLLRGDDRRAA
jgi:nucleoside recognition membrane protein YjiH